MEKDRLLQDAKNALRVSKQIRNFRFFAVLFWLNEFILSTCYHLLVSKYQSIHEQVFDLERTKDKHPTVRDVEIFEHHRTPGHYKLTGRKIPSDWSSDRMFLGESHPRAYQPERVYVPEARWTTSYIKKVHEPEYIEAQKQLDTLRWQVFKYQALLFFALYTFGLIFHLPNWFKHTWQHTCQYIRFDTFSWMKSLIRYVLVSWVFVLFFLSGCIVVVNVLMFVQVMFSKRPLSSKKFDFNVNIDHLWLMQVVNWFEFMLKQVWCHHICLYFVGFCGFFQVFVFLFEHHH